MLILSIESSTSAASVALINDKGVLGEYTLNFKKQHSILLMNLIDSILKNNDVNVKDIDGIVVSKGPGSFTGLRIGMATAKGLCLGANKPLLSISSLDGLAYNEISFPGIICPIMDALRDNVFTSFYRNNNGKLEKLIDHSHMSIDELIQKSNELNEPIIFVGDGIVKHREKLNESIEKANFSSPANDFTKASSIGIIGFNMLKEGIHDDLNESAPMYLRKSQAEREYDKKMELSNNGEL